MAEDYKQGVALSSAHRELVPGQWGSHGDRIGHALRGAVITSLRRDLPPCQCTPGGTPKRTARFISSTEGREPLQISIWAAA